MVSKTWLFFQPREVFVIGESYKPTLDSQVSARSSSVIGQAYPKETASHAPKNVVVIGSRLVEIIYNLTILRTNNLFNIFTSVIWRWESRVCLFTAVKKDIFSLHLKQIMQYRQQASFFLLFNLQRFFGDWKQKKNIWLSTIAMATVEI